MDGAFSVDSSRSGGSGGSSNLLSPWGYYTKVWKQFGDFSGRARRREYWWFNFVNWIVVVAIYFLAMYTSPTEGPSGFWLVIMVVYLLAVMIPGLAVTVRRLHDTGKSGWWILINFVPYLGAFVLFIFTVLDSSPGPNDYGSNPKAEVNVYEFSEIFS